MLSYGLLELFLGSLESTFWINFVIEDYHKDVECFSYLFFDSIFLSTSSDSEIIYLVYIFYKF